MDEARLEAAVEKIEQLDEFIAQAVEQDELDDFRGKWGEKIAEVEPYKKGLYGDEWDEGKNLFGLVKEQRDAGIDEAQIDATLEQYFLDTIEKFQHLAEIASTPAEATAAEEVVQAAEEGLAQIENGEAGEINPPNPEEESEEEPEEEDLSWMEEEDPHEAMIASHFGD